MKKYNFLALLLISFILFSCSKNNDITAPVNTSTQAEQQNTSLDLAALKNKDLSTLKSNLPEFNEKNSKKLAWAEFPAQLRNAKPLGNLKQLPQKGEAQASAISYQFYVGYWGGTGGCYNYSMYPTLAGSRIIAIAVRSGSYVDAITVYYMDAYGNVYYGGSAGGTGGTYYLSFFDANEYIYAAGGRSGAYLDHLYIWTNKKTLSYGGWGGTYFQYVTPSSYYQILGFWGGSCVYIDRMGFYIYSRW